MTHPTRTSQLARTDLAHHLLGRATSGQLVRRDRRGDAYRYVLDDVELSPAALSAVRVLNDGGFVLWLPLWEGGEHACPTGLGRDVLAEWDREHFGEQQ